MVKWFHLTMQPRNWVYESVFTEPVIKILRTLDKPDRKIIGSEIRKFQNDMPVNIIKLKNSNIMWRLRAGNWRVLMEKHFDQDDKLYYVVSILRRRDAYRDL